MRSTTLPFTIEQVVDLLRLKKRPGQEDVSNFDVTCPLCGGKYKMSCSREKNTWHCYRCGESGGTMGLYAQVVHGDPNYKVKDEIISALGQNKVRDIPMVRCAGIQPASDSVLDKAYSALLSLPEFQISRDHHENLINRGLREEAIRKNAYASFIPIVQLMKMFKLEEINRAENIIKSLDFSSIASSLIPHRRQLIAGYLVCQHIHQKHPDVDLKCVPGFFQVQQRDFFVYREGMAIPTRNINGEICALQIRKDGKAAVRYVTVSSKGLPGGPTEKISRTHFPRANAEFAEGTTVYLTEGPLKSDVALDLFQRMGEKRIAFLALQGVNNTRELESIAKALLERNVQCIKIALDADKMTNINVMKASRAIRKRLHEAGIRAQSFTWPDDDYAKARFDTLSALCEQCGLPYTMSGNVYLDIAGMTQLLAKNKIKSDFVIIDGEKREETWQASTKGIDDYLLTKYRLQKAKGR